MSKALKEMKKAVSNTKKSAPAKKPSPIKVAAKKATPLPAATTRIHDVAMTALSKAQPKVVPSPEVVEVPVVVETHRTETVVMEAPKPLNYQRLQPTNSQPENGPVSRGSFGVMPTKRYSKETKEKTEGGYRREVPGFSQPGSGFSVIK